MRKLLVALAIVTPLLFQPLPLAAAENPAVVAIYFDGGKGVAIGGLTADGRLLLDAEAMAHILQQPFVDQGAEGRIVVGGKTVTRCRQIKGITYVDAVELVASLGLKGEIKDDGATLELWSAEGLSRRPQLSLSLLKREKLTSPYPGEDDLSFTLELRNQGQMGTTVSGDNIFLIDSENNVYPCASDFQVALTPRAGQKVEKILFNLPQRKSPKCLILVINDKEVARLNL